MVHLAEVEIPRPITGSVGSRVRVVLGATGNDWLLLLDHDNGDRKWQSKDWKGVSNAVAKQLNNCTDKGRDIKAVDFGRTGAWFINGQKPGDGTCGHYCWGDTSGEEEIRKWAVDVSVAVSFGSDEQGGETCAILRGDNDYHISGGVHKDLGRRLKRIQNRGKSVNFVRLFHKGYFFVSDDEGTHWYLGGNISSLYYLMEELQKTDGAAEEVAVSDNCQWVVIREDSFETSGGVDKRLKEMLSKFFADQRRWVNEREGDIQEALAADGLERLTIEQVEQAERQAQAVQRIERELGELVVSAADEAREASKRAERGRVQRRTEVEKIERSISLMQAKLGDRLVEEANDIKSTRKVIEEMEGNLKQRVRSLRDSLQPLPQSIRDRVSLDGIEQAEAKSSVCVACQDKAAVMAVVPCGHVCLCSDCSGICMNGEGSQQCPMCRANMQSVLRVYF